MTCPVRLAEIEHDHAQYAFERSAEHLAATLALKDARHSFISDLLANNYHTVGQNTYTLRDAIECVQDDDFWAYVPRNHHEPISELINDDGLVESLYEAGILAAFHNVILAAVESLADAKFN